MQLYMWEPFWSLKLYLDWIFFRKELLLCNISCSVNKSYIYVYQFVFRVTVYRHLTKTYIWFSFCFCVLGTFLKINVNGHSAEGKRERRKHSCGHAIVPSPFLCSVRISEMHTHMLSLFFKPLRLGFEPRVSHMGSTSLNHCAIGPAQGFLFFFLVIEVTVLLMGHWKFPNTKPSFCIILWTQINDCLKSFKFCFNF